MYLGGILLLVGEMIPGEVTSFNFSGLFRVRLGEDSVSEL